MLHIAYFKFFYNNVALALSLQRSCSLHFQNANANTKGYLNSMKVSTDNIPSKIKRDLQERP
jgi:hypothetical protein